jgi:L-glutamine---4-(methylsulfanyl)-2-oxobutanoate aminotransferase
MTRLVNAYHPDDGINLSQGFPDFAAPQAMKDAAAAAIQADINQYAVTWGTKGLRDGIAAKTERFLGYLPDPETEITVCCGATEAMISTLMAVVNPGDEVIVFEPLYENYGPDCILCDASPRFVPLRPPDWTYDPDELAAAFGPNTRAIIVNTPNNPTGKVFPRSELEFIADLCQRHDALAITDEIYEHIVYDGLAHISMATLPGMRERTITVNGLSKTFSVTGWRIGYTIAPKPITAAIRKVHDFLTVGAPAPLQEGGIAAMALPDAYYQQLQAEYEQRRDFIVDVLRESGFGVFVPHGAYYVMTDISPFGFRNDVAFADWLVRDAGIAVVPGSSFYSRPADGAHLVRFAFPKRIETLRRAADRLVGLRSQLPT